MIGAGYTTDARMVVQLMVSQVDYFQHDKMLHAYAWDYRNAQERYV